MLFVTHIQFHVHAPAEHTFDGVRHDLELHIVHSDTGSSGRYTVLAIFFDTVAGGNTENEFIESLKANENNPTVNLDMEKLVRQLDLSTVYTYDGSLTTPTCDELVHFHLTTDVLPISDAQLAYFTDRWAGNSTFANGNGNNRKI